MNQDSIENYLLYPENRDYFFISVNKLHTSLETLYNVGAINEKIYNQLTKYVEDFDSLCNLFETLCGTTLMVTEAHPDKSENR